MKQSSIILLVFMFTASIFLFSCKASDTPNFSEQESSLTAASDTSNYDESDDSEAQPVVYQTLSEQLTGDIDGKFREEMNESISTGEMKEVAEKYAKKWEEVADEYYQKLITYETQSWTDNEKYPSLDEFHSYIQNAKANWDTYYENAMTNNSNILRAIYQDGTIQYIHSAQYKYGLKMEWALYLVNIYDELTY